MSGQEPWWASGDDPDAVPTEDPLASHTRARSGWREELAEEIDAAQMPPEPEPGDVGARGQNAGGDGSGRRRSPEPEPGDVGARGQNAGGDGSGRRRSPEPSPDVPHWLGDALALVGRVTTDMTQRLQAGDDGFRGEDPASRHPAGARRPTSDAHGPDVGGGGPGGGPGRPHPPGEVCNACPFCLGLRALKQVRPEVIGHLSDAAHHLSLALRAVADAAVDDEAEVTRIPLDDD